MTFSSAGWSGLSLIILISAPRDGAPTAQSAPARQAAAIHRGDCPADGSNKAATTSRSVIVLLLAGPAQLSRAKCRTQSRLMVFDASNRIIRWLSMPNGHKGFP